jgi:monovalent cation:H+ antiporter-2, CPA2 family
VQDQRDARYNLLRGYFHGADDDSVDELHHERLATVSLPAASAASGISIGDFGLHDLGVRVVSLRRVSGNMRAPSHEVLLQGGDTLVLSGKAAMLAVAEEKLLNGR